MLKTPEKNAVTTRRRFNKGAFYRQCRMLHAYLSAAAFVLLMFFALSGLLLNHPQWFSPERKALEPTVLQLDPATLEQALASEAPAQSLSDLIASQTSIVGDFQDADIDEVEGLLRFTGVKGSTDVFIDLETATAEVETSRANMTSIIHDLHRGKDTGVFWKRLIDVTSILILAMSLAGLILFFSLRFRLATSLKIMGGTVAVFVAMFVFLTP